MRELHFIQHILAEMADLVRRRYSERLTMDISSKTEAADLLTATDLEVQRRVHKAIQGAFPGDRLVAEEERLSTFPEDPSVRCWVLDPIDGTHNFVKGLLPAFGVSLGFAEGGTVQAGGIAFPVLQKTFLAMRGEGTTLNGETIHVSNVSDIRAAKVEVDFSRKLYRDPMLRLADKVLREAGQVRCHGSAVAAICAVASGDADGYIAPGLSPWDFAAGLVIVEEAGGTVTRLDARPVQMFDATKGLLISNGILHATLHAMLSLRTPVQ